MEGVSVLMGILKARNVITPLEQDILDTSHELNKTPFDRDFAIKKSLKNNTNHSDIFIAISPNPTTVFKFWVNISNEDIYFNLTK